MCVCVFASLHVRPYCDVRWEGTLVSAIELVCMYPIGIQICLGHTAKDRGMHSGSCQVSPYDHCPHSQMRLFIPARSLNKPHVYDDNGDGSGSS